MRKRLGAHGGCLHPAIGIGPTYNVRTLRLDGYAKVTEETLPAIQAAEGVTLPHANVHSVGEESI